MERLCGLDGIVVEGKWRVQYYAKYLMCCIQGNVEHYVVGGGRTGEKMWMAGNMGVSHLGAASGKRNHLQLQMVAAISAAFSSSKQSQYYLP